MAIAALLMFASVLGGGCHRRHDGPSSFERGTHEWGRVDYVHVIALAIDGTSLYDGISGRPLTHSDIVFLDLSEGCFTAFSEGLCPAKVRSGEKAGYINRRGDFLIQPAFDRAGHFSCGRAIVAVNGKTGIIDKQGDWILRPGALKLAGQFSEGLCSYVKDGKWGFVDCDGKERISAAYQMAHEFHDGRALVKDIAGAYLYIDLRGEPIIRLPKGAGAYEFHEGLVRFEERVPMGKVEAKEDWVPIRYGFMSRNGDVVIKPKFSSAGDFSEGLAPVSLTDTGLFSTTHEFFAGGAEGDPVKPHLWGFIDRKGEVVISLRYERVGHFSGGLAPFRERRKWGFIDREGHVVIPAKYDMTWEFDNGLAMVVIDRHIRVINQFGEVILATDREYRTF
jgi:hypothetical protein